MSEYDETEFDEYEYYYESLDDFDNTPRWTLQRVIYLIIALIMIISLLVLVLHNVIIMFRDPTHIPIREPLNTVNNLTQLL